MAYALGLDLGTTFTAAAVAHDGRIEVVSLGNHTAAIPSLVFLREDGGVLVGDAAQRRGSQEPERLARQFKRRFGDTTPIMLGHTPYSAERLMAMVLADVIGQVSERRGGPPDAIAIAHPANWGPYKIDLLRQAAQLAGVNDAIFVTEPEGAAVHYAAGERIEPGELVAVYDLGGGTFDAAVLRRTAGGFETLGQPQGVERLGGIDFDEAVFSHVRAALGDELEAIDQDDPATRAAVSRLREECVAAKEALSDDSETSIAVMLPGLQTQIRWTRNEFEDAIRPALRETVSSLQRAIELAGVTAADLRAIVIAGGSSRMPIVREMVSELGRPVTLDAHPKHTVALGAALVAAGSATTAPTDEIAAIAASPMVSATAPLPNIVASDPAGPVPPPPGRADNRSTGGRPRWLAPVAIGGVFAVAAGLGLALMLGGGDDGDAEVATTQPTAPNPAASTTASPTVTEPVVVTTPATTEADAPQECTSTSGRCVFIDEISEDTTGLVAAYSTFGYEPRIDPAAGTFHIHFYFDTIAVEEAGSPGQGPWTLWDVDENGANLFHGPDGVQRNEIPAGATQLCAVVADFDHSLDEDPQPSCARIP